MKKKLQKGEIRAVRAGAVRKHQLLMAIDKEMFHKTGQLASMEKVIEGLCVHNPVSLETTSRIQTKVNASQKF